MRARRTGPIVVTSAVTLLALAGCEALLDSGSLTDSTSDSGSSSGGGSGSGSGSDSGSSSGDGSGSSSGSDSGSSSGDGSGSGSGIDSGSSSGGGSGSSSGGIPDGGHPGPPLLGTLIDRVGRPGVNTLLNSTFSASCLSPGLCSAKDSYNTDGTPSSWSSDWAGALGQGLGIYDGLDNICGNQAGYNATLGGTTYPNYGALAGILAQDALQLNMDSTVCNEYLAVEVNTLGATNTDCGGRTLTENAIDVTYNLLAGTEVFTPDGGIGGPVTNGITAPASAPSTTFPYLAAPH